jgi:hypothetical protein
MDEVSGGSVKAFALLFPFCGSDLPARKWPVIRLIGLFCFASGHGSAMLRDWLQTRASGDAKFPKKIIV